MNRWVAEPYFKTGDLVGLDLVRPVGTPMSKLFEEVLNTAYGQDLDLIIEKCLCMTRITGNIVRETDMEFRARATAVGTALDVVIRRMYGQMIPGDDALMDNWIKAVDTAHSRWDDIKKNCFHHWKLYQGLFDTYEYCPVCGERQKK